MTPTAPSPGASPPVGDLRRASARTQRATATGGESPAAFAKTLAAVGESDTPASAQSSPGASQRNRRARPQDAGHAAAILDLALAAAPATGLRPRPASQGAAASAPTAGVDEEATSQQAKASLGAASATGAAVPPAAPSSLNVEASSIASSPAPLAGALPQKPGGAISADAANAPATATDLVKPGPPGLAASGQSGGSGGPGAGTGGGPQPHLARPEAGEAAALAVTSLSSEVVPPSPTTQVLQLLSSLDLQGGAEEADTGVASPSAPAEAAPRPVAASETITLELSPQNLGRVTVTLRRRGETVDVRIGVDSRETLASLAQDRHQLAAALGPTRGALDLAYAPSAAASSLAAATGSPGGRAQTADTASGQGGRQSGHRDGSLSSQGNDDVNASAAPDAPASLRDGSLYL